MKDMGKMLKQVQKLQQEMDKLQEELARKTISRSSGGGIVTATVNCRQELIDIKIDPSAIDPDDPEMLEDLIIAAVNAALEEASKEAQNEMAKLAGLPGLDSLPVF